MAITELGNGLHEAKLHEEALSVKEADLSMMRRVGGSVSNILAVQGNLANTYARLGRDEEALRMRRDVYSGRLKVQGEEHEKTLRAAHNYADSLSNLKRYEEAKVLLRKVMPAARRILGEGHKLTLMMRMNYAKALYQDAGATLDDFREAVTTLEDAGRIARRVLGGAHPTTVGIEASLENARAKLRTRETPSPGSS